MTVAYSMIKLILPLLLASCLASCGPEAAQEMPAEANNPLPQTPPIEVKIAPVQKKAFPLRVITTGTLQASRQTPITIETAGQIAEMQLQEGAFVQKGALLLRLEDQEHHLKLEQSYLTLDEADVNKKDLLLSNGGQAEVDTSVSPEKLKLILTLSGYDRAKHAIQLATLELAKTKVFAPFSGVIANVKVKPYQRLNAGEELCTLIDPTSFEVSFKLLETEALQVKLGQALLIQPIALPEGQLTAAINAINPIVDEQGLVSLRARLSSASIRLFEGQNVKVILEQQVPQQLIIPKTAVVLRSNKAVVFSYEQATNLAKWHYVTIGHENDESVTITEGLEGHETIIYSGNLNLDHDALVKVMEK
ncbi:MAG: efflux RND transporter periplasmic adaptor subunit [Saprospiraceae bacterium]